MEKYSMKAFVEIIQTLRGENGCPWDKEQTHESLINCVKEEAYEVVDAIESHNMAHLKEELGDLLLQVVMHGVIAEEKQEFTIDDVIQGICDKMIHRHPHVFGTASVENSAQVLHNWEAIKRKEHNEATISESMKNIPRALPANMRAEKVQKKAAKVGFDFENYDQILDKVYEELEELKMARKMGNKDYIQEEFGDLMFAIVNLSRFLQLNAENSLTNATDKFINRFVDVEVFAKSEGSSIENMSIEELDSLWNRVKEANKKHS